MNLKRIVLFFATCLLIACSSTRQTGNHANERYTPADKALFNEIAIQDSLLFHAFNTRDMETFRNFFANSLELYQDNEGVRSYEQTIEAFKSLFAKDYVLTRTLVANSLEVYPIKGYGAIQTGRHTFCHTENGKLICATFKFLNIWERQKGQWKITRLVTYDHKS